jgi:hypothetical protein
MIKSPPIEKTLEKHVFWFDDAADNELEQEFRDNYPVQDDIAVLFEDKIPDEYMFDN